MTTAWIAVAGAGAALIGGAMQSSASKKNANTAASNSAADREANAANYERALQALHAKQSNPYGESSWTEGADGKFSQTTTMNPADQQRLDQWRQIQANKMNVAGNFDYGSLTNADRFNRFDSTGNGGFTMRPQAPPQMAAPGVAASAGGQLLGGGMSGNAPVAPPQAAAPVAPVAAETPPFDQKAYMDKLWQESQAKQKQDELANSHWYDNQSPGQ